MRIVHLTVVRQLTSGQTKQLGFEHAASKTLEGVDWTTLAFHAGPETKAFSRQIPYAFRGQMLRKFYGWLIALRLSRTYDVVIMRHMTFDPFALLFAPLIRNRVSVHHAKEVEELLLIREGWKGRLASYIERVTGRVAVRSAMMIFGVTEEIAEYERDTRAPRKPIGVYSNGIEASSIKLLTDRRKPDEVHAIFLCGTFSTWHGLDKLIAAVDEYEAELGHPKLKIHLVGKLSIEQENEIAASEVRARTFFSHGLLSEDEYRSIAERCDIGIGSLALERKNLTEGSTLKIREMLAMGLPVLSGHEDVALPKESPFVRVQKNIKVSDILDFASSTKALTRTTVRENSIPLISKAGVMMKASRQLKTFVSISL